MSKTIKIDSEKCIACGMCAVVCPNIFDENLLGYAFIKNDIQPINSLNVALIEVIKTCPSRAIKLKSLNENNSH